MTVSTGADTERSPRLRSTLASSARTRRPARVSFGNESDALTAVKSTDWATLVAAGRWLAVDAGPQCQARLLALLTDLDNTAV